MHEINGHGCRNATTVLSLLTLLGCGAAGNNVATVPTAPAAHSRPALPAVTVRAPAATVGLRASRPDADPKTPSAMVSPEMVGPLKHEAARAWIAAGHGDDAEPEEGAIAVQVAGPFGPPSSESTEEHPQGIGFGANTLWQWLKSPFNWGTAVETPHNPWPFGPMRFSVGANLPWVSYGGDFGANEWSPDGGVATPEKNARLEAAMARLEATGIDTARWFMFCDARAGLRFTADGTPEGLDAHVFDDVDAALASARRHHVRLVFALVDFAFFQAPEISQTVHKGGHADVARDAAKRDAFMGRVLAPMLDRFGHDPTILAWDIVNEPEWSVLGWGSFKPAQSVSAAEMRNFIRDAVGLVHARSNQLTTVGSASTRWLKLVRGLGLDFYQPHWYDHFEAMAPLGRAVSLLKLDRPVILGEFPTRNSNKTLGQIMDTAMVAGYHGAWPWAMLSTDTATDFASAQPQIVSWRAKQQGRLAPIGNE